MTKITKKQKQVLDFIINFLDEHGYSPSYREIKDGLNYNSVATVAKHIDNLYIAGLIRKKENEARTIEVVGRSFDHLKTRRPATEAEEKWLVGEVERQFSIYESGEVQEQTKLDELYVLVGALKILGLQGPFTVYAGRLRAIQNGVNNAESN
ncbi:TPA: hypothetical protein EYO12_03680 [Candidatus Saccharibacteria bacterium]|nr:hypothetical protein [Candidatus Saccharibacteria bacterium]HIO87869.1 hypothetical protein [Candidatus Saccharibacteria bacterium]